MTREKEASLFEQLWRNRQLREWLETQLQRQVEILLVNPDHASLIKAQGASGFIKGFLDRMDAAESAAKRQ